MDKKSKIFFVVFFMLIASSIGFAYYRIMLRHDYNIESQVDCDPTTEKCFVYHCDLTVEECTGDEVKDTSYYKIVKRNAGKIPLCDPKDESCQPFVCGENEKDCEEILCDLQTKQESDQCNDPVQYVIDNPVAEESASCNSAEDPTCKVQDQSTEEQAGDSIVDSEIKPVEENPTNVSGQ